MSRDAGRRPCRRPRAVCLFVAVIVALGSTSAGQQPVAPQTGAPRQLWPQRPGVLRPIDLAVPAAEPPRQVAAANEPGFAPNEVLVQFEPDVPEATRAAARAAANASLAGMLRADGRLERLTTSLAVADAVAILQALPQVEFAEPNWIVRHYAESNDPFYLSGALWGMYGDATAPANVFGSQAGEAWAAGQTGSNAIYVAVIDEGIDFNHPDLAPNIWTNPFDPDDGVDNDGNGRVDDVHGWDFLSGDNSTYDGPQDDHGTHVAGTIGARGGNGIGVAGVAWNVTIITAKFLAGTGTTANAVQALDYVADLKVRHGLNIIATNNSWGGSEYSNALHQAIIRAAKQGILFVAAAGNGGSDGVGDNNDVTPHYPSAYSTTIAAGSESPASYDAVIAVAALTSTGERATFSNFGSSSVDIGAPGSDITSTSPQGGYQAMSGTSMAAPHVTGAAVLYKSAHPGASADEIRSGILGLGTATPSLAGITVTGRRLNVGDFGSARKLTINDKGRSEGNAGTANATFTVSLSAQSPSPVTVRYTTSDLTATSGTIVANAAAVSIPSSGSASPYPSTITVPSGYGTITNVRVVLNGFSHAGPADVDVLLVGPGGQTCVLMSDVGGTFAATNLTLTIDDAGIAMPTSDPLASGTFRPTNTVASETFASPAPAGPYGSALAVFNGTAAAGAWRLFVVDDLTGFSGTLAGGWSLSLTTTAGGDYVPTSGIVTFPAGSTSQPLDVPVIGDLTVEPSETFKVALFDSSGASIGDATAIGTIVNDDFTDPALGGLPIKATHIVELRDAINGLRTSKGLGAFTFTDPALTAQSTTVRAIHVVELRSALAGVYTSGGLSAPTYTDQTITPGVTVVRALHITEIRTALVNAP